MPLTPLFFNVHPTPTNTRLWSSTSPSCRHHPSSTSLPKPKPIRNSTPGPYSCDPGRFVAHFLLCGLIAIPGECARLGTSRFGERWWGSVAAACKHGNFLIHNSPSIPPPSLFVFISPVLKKASLYLSGDPLTRGWGWQGRTARQAGHGGSGGPGRGRRGTYATVGWGAMAGKQCEG